MRDIPPGVLEAAFDYRLRVGAAGLEPLFERLAGGRQNEDAARRRQPGTHLTRSLPVDLEQQQLTAVQRVLDGAQAGSVKIVEHLRMRSEERRVGKECRS